MRFPGVAVCTLTVLLAGGLTAQANENSSLEDSTLKPVTSNWSAETPSVTSREIEPITPAQIQQEELFLKTAAIESGQESRLALSASGQNAQVVSEGQVETLEEATLQTDSAQTPKAEGLASGNIVTELATPVANRPVSDESLNKTSALSSRLEENETGGTIEEGAVLSQAEALHADDLVPQSLTNNASQLLADAQPDATVTCLAQRVDTPDSTGNSATSQLAQGGAAGRCPRPQAIPRLVVPEAYEEFAASPALSIYIPVGYGADNNTLFLSGSYQASVREDEGSVGSAGVGIGIGDADKAVGLELSYALATTDDEFGEGGFNAKLHRRLGQDLSAALGWNGFLNIGHNDFEHSKYGVITKVFRTQESLNSAFSRVAFTVGVGDNQFRSNGAIDDGDNNINVFGNVAVRVVRPVSFIAEWTGQDLALGLSIAPFKNFPLVITPAVRDVAGAGDGARFVIGAGTAIRF